MLQMGLVATTGAFLLALVPSARSESDSYGYSYLRMKVGGVSLSNFVVNEKYNGWLQLVGVEAESHSPAGSAGAALGHPSVRGRTWMTLPATLHSGRGGEGKIRFGAGDDGTLGPLLEAQKHKTLIPQADLDLYDEDKSTLIGRYRLGGIRIVSMEDATASACPMFIVTLSFQSIKKK